MASEGLAAGRARRHGAGNRMRALLDGVFEAEEGFQEVENDDEFEDKGDGDGDVYDSDFKSSDDEADAELAGETELQTEHRLARKEARRLAERKAAVTRPVGLKPSLHSVKHSKEPGETEDVERRPTKKRRYMLPLPVDNETGELLDGATRKSSRNATVRSKKELHSKLKDEQEKRAAQPKKVKQAARALTQDELIAEALETEEINLASLDVFLTEEEERRARNANLKRDAVEGPLLRFVSRGEKVRVPMIVEVEISAPPSGYGSYKRPYVPGPLLSLPRPPNVPGSTPYYSAFGNNSYGRPPLPSSAAASGSSKDTSVTRPTPASSPYYYPLPNPPSRTGNAAPTSTLSLNSGVHSGKLVTQAKNYVILETPGASPAKDYQYLFGDHVDWGSLKVLPKNHSSVRKPTPCPITGLPARYLHPVSGIPFANLTAYQTIESLLRHQYVWSEGLDCYIGDEQRTEGATGVPEGWDDAVTGRRSIPEPPAK